MKLTGNAGLVIVFGALLAGTIYASNDEPSDEVLASFDRMLNHEAPRHPGHSQESTYDPMQSMVNARLWTSQPQDPVVASFDRMFEHEPTTVTSHVVVPTPDTMQQMVNQALWNYQPADQLHASLRERNTD